MYRLDADEVIKKINNNSPRLKNACWMGHEKMDRTVEFLTAMKGNQHIVNLEIYCWEMLDEQWIVLRDLLINTTTIKTLRLDFDIIRAEHIHYMIDVFSNNTIFTHIRIVGHMNPGTEGVVRAIMSNPNLQVFTLPQYSPGVFVTPIIEALPTHESLVILDLNNRQLAFSQCQMLGQALTTNKTLINLNLSKCGLQDKGCREIVKGLKENNTLKRLDLSFNGWGGSFTWTAIYLMLQVNMSLVFLDVRVQIQHDMYSKIASRTIKRNKTLYMLLLEQWGDVVKGFDTKIPKVTTKRQRIK